MKVLSRILWLLAPLAIMVAGTFYWNPLWVNDEHIRFNLWRSHVSSHSVEAGGYRLHYYEASPLDGSAGLHCSWCMGWRRARRTGRR
jgi:hypothetical protein